MIRLSKIFTIGEDLAGVLGKLEDTTVVGVLAARVGDRLIVRAAAIDALASSVSTGVSLSTSRPISRVVTRAFIIAVSGADVAMEVPSTIVAIRLSFAPELATMSIVGGDARIPVITATVLAMTSIMRVAE